MKNMSATISAVQSISSTNSFVLHNYIMCWTSACQQSLTMIPRVATPYEQNSKKDLKLLRTIAQAQGEWNHLCELFTKT